MKHATRIGKAFFAILILCPVFVRAQVGVVNGLTQEKVCKPGEAFQSFIQIKNYGADVESVRIYQTDYSFTFDGKSLYDSPGNLGRSNAAWIKVGSRQVTIPAQGKVDVLFSVKVPDDPALVGTYWSVIMVEGLLKVQAARGGIPKNKINFGVNQVTRYGVQVVIHIGDTGLRKVKFLNTELLQDKSQKHLQVDVENVGERWLRPFSYVELYNDKGELAGKFDGDRWRIFPGTSVRYTFDLSKIAQGKYKALVVLDNKDSYVFGGQYHLNLGAPGNKAGAKQGIN